MGFEAVALQHELDEIHAAIGTTSTARRFASLSLAVGRLRSTPAWPKSIERHGDVVRTTIGGRAKREIPSWLRRGDRNTVALELDVGDWSTVGAGFVSETHHPEGSRIRRIGPIPPLRRAMPYAHREVASAMAD